MPKPAPGAGRARQGEAGRCEARQAGGRARSAWRALTRSAGTATSCPIAPAVAPTPIFAATPPAESPSAERSCSYTAIRVPVYGMCRTTAGVTPAGRSGGAKRGAGSSQRQSKRKGTAQRAGASGADAGELSVRACVQAAEALCPEDGQGDSKSPLPRRRRKRSGRPRERSLWERRHTEAAEGSEAGRHRAI